MIKATFLFYYFHYKSSFLCALLENIQRQKHFILIRLSACPHQTCVPTTARANILAYINQHFLAALSADNVIRIFGGVIRESVLHCSDSFPVHTSLHIGHCLSGDK
jgi:hypothetical protein